MSNDGITREGLIVASAVMTPNPTGINTTITIEVNAIEATFTNLVYCGTVQCGEGQA